MHICQRIKSSFYNFHPAGTVKISFCLQYGKQICVGFCVCLKPFQVYGVYLFILKNHLAPKFDKCLIIYTDTMNPHQRTFAVTVGSPIFL